MDNPILYRKRIIPDECILLKDDQIISCDDNVIITKWKALHPKKDLHHGASVFLLNEGFKVSKFCYEDGSLLYWYCDIIDYEYKEDTNELIVIDLLADVIIYPDGMVKVVDIAELVEALDNNSITMDLLKGALLKLDKLLNIIYSGGFGEYKKYLEDID